MEHIYLNMVCSYHHQHVLHSFLYFLQQDVSVALKTQKSFILDPILRFPDYSDLAEQYFRITSVSAFDELTRSVLENKSLSM